MTRAAPHAPEQAAPHAPASAPASAAASAVVTRFAPSPTGALHLGHGYSAVRAARLAPGARLILRLDDIDRDRCREAHVAGIAVDLEWLGITATATVRQSERAARHADALDALRALGLAYPCRCTRAELLAAAATAPHGPPGHATAPVHDGPCRTAVHADPDRPVAWRLDMAAALEAANAMAGAADPLGWREPGGDGGTRWHAADPRAHGDIVLARKGVGTSYHLSTVVDDADLGITHVARGIDLRPATAVHALLHRLLHGFLDDRAGAGSGPPAFPVHVHHRLVVDADGRRLAKRDRAATLAAMRDDGIDGIALADRLAGDHLPIGFSLSAP